MRNQASAIRELPITARSRRDRHLPLFWESCEKRLLLAFSVSDPIVEGPKPGQPQTYAIFQIQNSPSDIEHTLSVDYSTSDGTAIAGRDYQAKSGTLIFSASAGPQTVTVPIYAVTRDTVNQTFFLNLSNPQGPGSSIGVAQAAGVIHTTPDLTINNSTVTRPSQGTTTAVFTVSMFPVSPVPVTVNYATSDVTAVSGRDYVSTQGTLTLAPGETSKSIDVSVLGGTQSIPTRTFQLNLSNATNSDIISPGYGVGTILDAHPAGVLNFSSASYNVDEDAGAATITVTRTSGIASGVTVSYGTIAGGSAVQGVNYLSTTGTLTFDAGQDQASFQVPVIHDSIVQPDVTVKLAISNPGGGGVLGSTTLATLNIHNVDSFIVTNTNPSGRGSLSQAIVSALQTPGFHTVEFAVPGPSPAVFNLQQPLPAITKGIGIDGTSEPGYAGSPIILLDGSMLGSGQDGLTLNAPGSKIAGLGISNFSGDGISLSAGSNDIEANLLSGNGGYGIDIPGNGSNNNLLIRNRIGTTANGSSGFPNAKGGIFLNNSSGNTIGGPIGTAGNVISGNGGSGIQIQGNSTGNVIDGNLIGLDATGRSPVPNAFDGIFLDNAQGNMIGGAQPGLGNVISANGYSGIRIFGGQSNTIQGNKIGTDVTGSIGLGGQLDGIYALNSANNAITGNTLSGNAEVGVQIQGPSSTGNLIRQNFIGTDSSGRKPVGNGLDGVVINDAVGNRITRNVVSANGSVGVHLLDTQTASNVVRGNFIGTNLLGQAAKGLGNMIGLFLNVIGSGNVIGGQGSNRNTIANNTQNNQLTNTAGRNPAFVVGFDTRTNAGKLTDMVISFNRGLDRASAQNLANYSLTATNGSGPVTISTAIYNDISKTVTLHLPMPTLLDASHTLIATGLRDRNGRLIDGRGNGLPGGPFVATIPSNSRVVLNARHGRKR